VARVFEKIGITKPGIRSGQMDVQMRSKICGNSIEMVAIKDVCHVIIGIRANVEWHRGLHDGMVDQPWTDLVARLKSRPSETYY